jgi:hypothetical protein
MLAFFSNVNNDICINDTFPNTSLRKMSFHVDQNLKHVNDNKCDKLMNYNNCRGLIITLTPDYFPVVGGRQVGGCGREAASHPLLEERH